MGDRERDHADLQRELQDLVGLKDANEGLKSAVLAANKRAADAENQAQSMSDQMGADRQMVDATIRGLQDELRNAQQADEARHTAEAEASRLQSELTNIQQGQEEEFAAISTEMDNLRSQLEESQKLASTLPGVMKQFDDEQAAHIEPRLS